MSNNDAVGQNIRKARIRCGMTQKELAKRLAITAAALSRWESGQRVVKFEEVVRISEILGIPIEEIKDSPGEPQGNMPKKDVNLNHGETVAQDWGTIAQTLAKSLILREENEKRRIELVEAVEAQARLKQAEAQADRAKTDKLAYEELKALLTELKASLGQDSRNEKAETADARKSLVNE